MQCVIDPNFKIVFFGEEYDGEIRDGFFIFDPDEKKLQPAAMQEIARANKLKLESQTMEDLSSAIKSKFKRGISMEIKSKLKKTIIKMAKEDATNDDILIHLVTQGIPFNKAARVFNSILEEAGIRVSLKTIQEVVDSDDIEIKGEGQETVEWAKVEELTAFVMEKVKGSTERQVNTCLRKRFRREGVDFPKKRAVRMNVNGRIHEWILNNKTAGNDELVEFVVNELEKPAKFSKRYIQLFNFARTFAGMENPTPQSSDNGSEKPQAAKKVTKKKATAKK